VNIRRSWLLRSTLTITDWVKPFIPPAYPRL
jgi:hypothetical protein